MVGLENCRPETGRQFLTQIKKGIQKENENNFIVTSLYSLTKEDFTNLIRDFKVLKNKKGEDYILSLIKGPLIITVPYLF
ncbi:hypothetical protein [Borreliella bavariensis]|uniref:hypothetical protein n=1 Tax=Borreliella bavariensis TaxID=664662 RepID=UPI00165E69A3|nr:hypothetical protein [Borreliella bavariensis]